MACLYQPIEAFVFHDCGARYEKFAVNQKARIFVSYVIKEFAHSFSCAYIELWMHLGSLESTQEARGALGYRLVQLLRIFTNFPRASITRFTHAKHEQILNWSLLEKDSTRNSE